jgi:hypothetical protein
MGRAAVKERPIGQPRGSHLRLAAPARTRPSKSNARAKELAARRNFRMFATLMLVFAALGMSRVWLSVEATRASLEADELRDSIRTVRYEGDMLEVRESALGSPSRIRAIAGKAMDMAPAASISYLDLSENSKKGTAHEAETVVKKHGLRETLSNVLDLAAGEAEVLLVGDVGLASTR